MGHAIPLNLPSRFATRPKPVVNVLNDITSKVSVLFHFGAPGQYASRTTDGLLRWFLFKAPKSYRLRHLPLFRITGVNCSSKIRDDSVRAFFFDETKLFVQLNILCRNGNTI